jgi:ribosomal protein S12 methylthiotransferase
MESLLKEAMFLADSGIKEIILVAQDVTRYGTDLYGKKMLVPLIRQLCETDVEWIRILYAYPEEIDDELICEFATNKKLLPYIDIPMQHIDDRILSAMGRRGGSTLIKQKIEKLRKSVPDIALRSTFILGFPGEDDRAFQTLLDFLREYGLTHAGAFVYSREKGTPSYNFSNRVPKSVAKQRLKEFNLAFQSQAEKQNERLIGKTLKVLCEGIDFEKQLFVGRSYLSSPSIDPPLYFSAKNAEVGRFMDVTVTGQKRLSLFGKVEK